jgi:hypothetical protein
VVGVLGGVFLETQGLGRNRQTQAAENAQDPPSVHV